MEDTIVALASAPGKSALAVIRLSGPQAISIVDSVWKGKKLVHVPSHTVHLGKIKDGGQVVDEVLATVMRAPRSYTGEDTVEISCHGSPYIVRHLLGLFHRMGARQAQPGEFTRRAFLNQKMDLVQAEAVADIIASESQAAHRAAMYQMRGGLSARLNALREQLIEFASLVELELDFAEEDVEFAERDRLKEFIINLRGSIAELIHSFSTGQAIKNGIPTVIVGKPNAGKSTLLNALAGEEKAIVSEIPGTTRDLIEDQIIVGGVQFRIIDTAGLRQTTDPIEAIGVERTKAKIQQAALALYLFDASDPESDQQGAVLGAFDRPIIRVANKADLITATQAERLRQQGAVVISAEKKQGLDELREAMLRVLRLDTSETALANARHYDGLLKTDHALMAALEAIHSGLSGELLAFHLRDALRHLGEITGTIEIDRDILGAIFSRFCIGK